MRIGLAAILSLVLSLGGMVFVSGCSCGTQSVDFETDRFESTALPNPLELRLVKGTKRSPKDLMVLYATGDGGWNGLDKDLFTWVAELGYAIAGFSSKDYLKNIEDLPGGAPPEQVAQDYLAIIRSAREALGVPNSTKVILAGLSRGSGLEVVAAGDPALQPNLAGVLAVALTAEEEHVATRTGEDAEPVMLLTYPYLRKFPGIPLSVIQSTHDRYLPASEAKRLFGADTAMRRFRAIEASTHSFSGACMELRNQVQSSLVWIRQRTGSR